MAPSGPVLPPTWAPASKDAIGTALGASRIWFTIAQGIITEVYSPRVDIPQLKDLGFIVADGAGFWVELRRLDCCVVTWLEDAIPAITVTHRHPRFTLTLEICTDPDRDTLLVAFRLDGDAALRLHVLAAPRLGGDATRNCAWAGDWEGRPVLWAAQGPFALALVAADRNGCAALLGRSVGCVGESDGWQDFRRNGRMSWQYAAAGPGQVALMAALPREGTLGLGLASSREAAATLALQSLAAGFETCRAMYVTGWRRWLASVEVPQGFDSVEPSIAALIRRSAAVIKVHEDRTFPGAFVASLAVPWGEANESRGGYHLVWARDLVETAGALIALGCLADARSILTYLIATQQADGHWLQNQWLGGKPFWHGIQLDQAAFPVLLAAMLADRGALDGIRVEDMVRRALQFIARAGPVTCQDRWEEDAGINTFTLAVTIAALVEGSRFLRGRARECALMLADAWNASIEEWTWVQGSALARRLQVPGYYMRIAPRGVLAHGGVAREYVRIRNRAPDPALVAGEQLAIDCLQIARFGLRDAADPHLTASVRAIDALLKSETPQGPVWHRYNGDGYGEHDDGAPFDGVGRGRGWPLLVGERGHFALLAGEPVAPFLRTMSLMTGRGGLIPEQVWDSAAIPGRGLEPGRPSGAAMPLVWAHAEFVKLAVSSKLGAPDDRPARTWERYRARRPRLDYVLWRPQHRVRQVTAGSEVRVLLPEPALLHSGTDGWQSCSDLATEDWGLGHHVRLPVGGLRAGQCIDFTIFWPQRNAWQHEDFHIEVIAPDP